MISRFFHSLRPLSSFFLISSKSCGKWMTTPLPRIERAFSLMIPLGRRWKSYSISPTTTVCPALLPPCKIWIDFPLKMMKAGNNHQSVFKNHTWHRHTISTLSANRSTILPFPSSPHCVPRTTYVFPSLFANPLLDIMNDLSDWYLEIKRLREWKKRKKLRKSNLHEIWEDNSRKSQRTTG